MRIGRLGMFFFFFGLSVACHAFGLGLGWEGSFVESAAFAHRLREKDSASQVRVVFLEEPVKNRAKSALAVFVSGGQLKAFAGPKGEIPLSGLAPADFRDEVKVRAALQAIAADIAASWAADEANGDKAIENAIAAVRNDNLLAQFPIDRVQLGASRVKADGTRERFQVSHLCVYEGGLHVAYRPGGGCTVLQIPVNPKHGFTPAAVKNGDLIEAILFAQAQEASMPGSMKQVSFAGWRSRAVSCGGAAAFYLADGKARAFNVFLGDVALESLFAAEVEDPFMAPMYAWVLLCRGFYDAGGESDEGRVRLDTFRKKLRSVAPQELPGDTSVLQLKRARAVLRASGVAVKLASGEQQLNFSYRGLNYSYTPTAGSWSNDSDFSRPAPPASLPFLTSAEPISMMRRLREGRTQLRSEVGRNLVENQYWPADPELGKSLLRVSVAEGDPEAALYLSRYLGDFAENPSEVEEATRAFLMAAQAGFGESIYNYGARMASGRGIKADAIEGLAYMLAAPPLPMSEYGIQQVKKMLEFDSAAIEKAMQRSVELKKSLAEAAKDGEARQAKKAAEAAAVAEAAEANAAK